MSATPLQMQSFYNQQSSTGRGHQTPHFASLKPQVGSGSSPYLPGYLFGNSPQSLGGNSLTGSGGGYQHLPSQQHNTQMRSSGGLSFSSPSNDQRQQRHKLSYQPAVVKDGAPPVEGLFSTCNGAEDIMETESSHQKLSETLFNHTDKSSFNETLFSPHREALIHQSPAQIDPFYTQGDSISCDDVMDATAVTVFGFPPAASSYILQQFSQYGTVERYEMHNMGNWMHVKYQTRVQAKKALSKNGKRFAHSIMIGVLPCIKSELSADSTSNVTVNSPAKLINNRRPSAMRSLASPNRMSGATEVFANENTPQKNDSVVAKALDYVFGW